MAHEQLIMKNALKLRVFDKHIGVWALGDRCPWPGGDVSKLNNYYKSCMNLVKSGDLEKIDSFFRVPGCKANFKNPHTKRTSEITAEFIRLPFESVEVYREKSIPEIGLRPDVLILLKDGDRARCVVLEVCLEETQEYLNSKINALTAWEGAGAFLSELFGVDVPWFDIVVDGLEHPKAITLIEFLREVV